MYARRGAQSPSANLDALIGATALLARGIEHGLISASHLTIEQYARVLAYLDGVSQRVEVDDSRPGVKVYKGNPRRHMQKAKPRKRRG